MTADEALAAWLAHLAHERRLSPRTLEKQRVIGGGPRFRKFGRRVMYAVADLDAYKRNLDSSVFRSALIMRPVFEAAATATRRIVFADGEDERVLRAARVAVADPQ